jgi:hypothetical protein
VVSRLYAYLSIGIAVSRDWLKKAQKGLAETIEPKYIH